MPFTTEARLPANRTMKEKALLLFGHKETQQTTNDELASWQVCSAWRVMNESTSHSETIVLPSSIAFQKETPNNQL
jgi:hypothetical protein